MNPGICDNGQLALGVIVEQQANGSQLAA